MRKPAYFSSEYSVDDLGNVYGKKGRVLKPSSNHGGYQIINYMKDGKQHGASVHRTVAIAFVPNPEGKEQVNHKDGNKKNNAASNLEWVTPLENTRHARNKLGFNPKDKITNRPVVAMSISEGIVKQFESIRSAGRWIDETYRVRSGASEVWKAIQGKRKSARGYVWEYMLT